jgi:hypothetical protein
MIFITDCQRLLRASCVVESFRDLEQYLHPVLYQRFCLLSFQHRQAAPTTGTIAIFQLFAAEFSSRFSFLLTTYTPSLPFPSLPFPSLRFIQTLQVVRKPLLMGPQMFKNENVFLTSTG